MAALKVVFWRLKMLLARDAMGLAAFPLLRLQRLMDALLWVFVDAEMNWRLALAVQRARRQQARRLGRCPGRGRKA